MHGVRWAGGNNPRQDATRKFLYLANLGLYHLITIASTHHPLICILEEWQSVASLFQGNRSFLNSNTSTEVDFVVEFCIHASSRLVAHAIIHIYSSCFIMRKENSLLLAKVTCNDTASLFLILPGYIFNGKWREGSMIKLWWWIRNTVETEPDK